MDIKRYKPNTSGKSSNKVAKNPNESFIRDVKSDDEWDELCLYKAS